MHILFPLKLITQRFQGLQLMWLCESISWKTIDSVQFIQVFSFFNLNQRKTDVEFALYTVTFEINFKFKYGVN